MDEQVWAIVVAGGSGRRFGRPKQFEQLNGRLVVEWAVATARSVADGIVLILPESEVNGEAFHFDEVIIGAGGSTRTASVRAGLELVPESVDIVVVHDAARPCASVELFESVVQAIRDGADGAIPALPLSDTVKEVQGDRVVATLDRSRLVRVQTPQAFSSKSLRAAYEDGDEATDDAALVERAGGRVVIVPGEESNLKVTSTEDLAHLQRWLSTTGTGGEHEEN